jgi:hypothetical protein
LRPRIDARAPNLGISHRIGNSLKVQSLHDK